MWTDYAVAGDSAAAMTAAEREIYDHRLIRRSEGSGFFSPVDALAEHRLSRTWLLRKLTEPAYGPTLVVTHHVPHSATNTPVEDRRIAATSRGICPRAARWEG